MAETISSVSTDDLKKFVSDTLQELRKKLASFTEQNLNRLPFQNSWTAAQVFDHLLKSYSVVETLNGGVKVADRNPLEKEKAIADVFLNFETKLKSPQFIVPDEKYFRKTELEERLDTKIMALTRAATLDLNMVCTDFGLPQMGHLTRAEWLYFVSYHTQRHLHQLQKIEAALS